MIFDRNIDLNGISAEEERRRIKAHFDYLQERLEMEDRSLRQMIAALRTGIRSLTQMQADTEARLAALEARVKELEEKN